MNNFARAIRRLIQSRTSRRFRRRRLSRTRSGEVLEYRALLSGTYSLVGDLRMDGNSSSEIDHGWIPETMVQVGPVTYFTATTPEAGHELWKTDGTEQGTVLVKDLIPGEYPRTPIDNRPSRQNGFETPYPYISQLTNVNGTLFFIADDGVDGLELWKSDGTDSGTVLIKELPFDEDGLNFAPELTEHNGDVYFQAYNDDHGWEIWKSDGTAVGTEMLKDIRPGTASSWASDFFSHAGQLYFAADNGSTGRELWISDGTSAGTTLLRDLNPGADPSLVGEFHNLNGTLVFSAAGVLWTSDGTPTGTNAFAAGSIQPGGTAVIGNTLYFPGYSQNTGTELWKTDGTPGGTARVKDIYAGPGSSGPSELTVVGGTLYFQARVDTGSYSADYQLWKSDGTASGTVLVKDLSPTIDNPTHLTEFAGKLVFASNGVDDQLGFVGNELWSTDGTEAGTVLLRDIQPGYEYGSPSWLVNLNGTLLFVADDGIHGSELWQSNGTTQGTSLLKDINNANASSWPTDLRNVSGRLTFVTENGESPYYPFGPTYRLAGIDDTSGAIVPLDDTDGQFPFGFEDQALSNGTLFFSAPGQSSDIELWKSDGTESGTMQVRNINAVTSSKPIQLTDADGTLFFVADDGAHGRELWKSDGSESGTLRVTDTPAGDIDIRYMTNVGGQLFFVSRDNEGGLELWKSDGSSAGTSLVRDIHPTIGSFPFLLTNVNGTLFFTADDGVHGRELWKSDGTEVGTTLVNDLVDGSNGSNPGHLTNAGGLLYFTALDGSGNRHFYASDGTQSGTVQLITDVGEPDIAAVIGQNVFFVVENASGELELWRSSGTPSGTQQLLTGHRVLSEFAVHNGQVYFAADDATHGTELWTTDGSVSGTGLVVDLNAGSGDGDPRRLHSHQGRLYFNATDGSVPRGLWRTDGTSSGTSRLTPASGQPNGVDPGSFTTVGNRLYFTASNNAVGRELFIVNEDATEPPSSAPTITSPGSTTQQLRPVISWDAVENATEYEIWVKNQSTGDNPFHQATVSATSYTPDVDFGIGRFNLWIRAKNSLGNGPWTSQYNFTINTRASVNDPGRFLNTHRPTLTWPELPGAVKYDLWIDDKLGGVSQYVRNQNVTETSWTPDSDMPLGLYHAWIRGIAADGTSGGWSVTTIFYVMPSPMVTAGNNPTFDRTPTFAWDALEGAVKYELFIRNRNTGGTELYQQNITALNFTVPSALADGPYRVWMLGVSDDNVRSFWTDPMDIFIGGRTDVLTPMGSTGDTTPEFTWRPVDGAVRYDLWVDQVGGQSQIIREQNLSTSSFTPGSALPAGDYRVWVRAISSTSETSAWSQQVDFTIAASFTSEEVLLVVQSPFLATDLPRAQSPLPTSGGEGQGEGARPRVIPMHSYTREGILPDLPLQNAGANGNIIEQDRLTDLWSRHREVATLLDESAFERAPT